MLSHVASRKFLHMSTVLSTVSSFAIQILGNLKEDNPIQSSFVCGMG
jgi:hypothetical protein